VTDDRRELLRSTFDTVAERYAASRPGYPPEAVAELARLAAGGRVLEIGCGTGQLTVPLAGHGLDITAVELGPELARVARRNLADHPRARVLVGAFERVELPEAAFDLVVAATSIKWVDPAVRVVRPARLLRPGGALAVLSTEHIAGGTAEFFVHSQACYERWDPENTPVGLRLQTPDELTNPHPELDDTPLFEPPRLTRYEQEIEYTTEEYLTLLLTYSNHLALAPDQQRGLLDCIRSLIDDHFDGRITKRYLNELRVSRRTDAAPPTDPPA
jgi:SAM-dependent methyltransferase